MATLRQHRWQTRLITLAVWALAVGSAVYWILRLGTPPAGPVVPAAALANPAPADTLAVARLLGAVGATPTPTAQAASRFALVGVAATASRQGAALIAVDGKPARPYRVGSRIDDNHVLQAVGPYAATLGASVDGPAAVTLTLPVPPATATVADNGAARVVTLLGAGAMPPNNGVGLGQPVGPADISRPQTQLPPQPPGMPQFAPTPPALPASSFPTPDLVPANPPQ